MRWPVSFTRKVLHHTIDRLWLSFIDNSCLMHLGLELGSKLWIYMLQVLFLATSFAPIFCWQLQELTGFLPKDGLTTAQVISLFTCQTSYDMAPAVPFGDKSDVFILVGIARIASRKALAQDGDDNIFDDDCSASAHGNLIVINLMWKSVIVISLCQMQETGIWIHSSWFQWNTVPLLRLEHMQQENYLIPLQPAFTFSYCLSVMMVKCILYKLTSR